MREARLQTAKRRSWFAAVLVIMGTACAPRAATCVAAALTPEARQVVEAESGRLGFSPLLPCGTGRGFTVTSVAIDTLPGTPSERRISFIVERNGARAYVLSETRSPITSTQIPQGTRPFRVSAGALTADGFVGASGSGGEMAYLRWRADEVTYELDATLGRALAESDVRAIAIALMRPGLGANR